MFISKINLCILVNLRKKLDVLWFTKEVKNNWKTSEFYEVKKTTFYKWEKAFDNHGEKGLLRRKPIAHNLPNQIKPEIVNKVLTLREDHKLGTWLIKWYLERHHDINISKSSVML